MPLKNTEICTHRSKTRIGLVHCGCVGTVSLYSCKLLSVDCTQDKEEIKSIEYKDGTIGNKDQVIFCDVCVYRTKE